ncbi:uncharacterized protein LOC131858440 [Cryptomeria japonica]|uniref:uncharacterized protein LOC131858440 n=1 Tax=Cryptomeria japonica TaxID=3369 RepID=UPI0027DA8924|nr:uncharacterized protein LOC131858440 [Cryptomeria japonica]
MVLKEGILSEVSSSVIGMDGEVMQQELSGSSQGVGQQHGESPTGLVLGASSQSTNSQDDIVLADLVKEVQEFGRVFGIMDNVSVLVLWEALELKQWNKSCFGNLYAMKRRDQDHLAVVTHQIRDLGFFEDLGREESHAVRELEEWEPREEIFWKQKDRVDWLQEGDMNTTFFHNSVQSRQNRSYISMLVDSAGIQLTSLHAMSHEATWYYSALFSGDSPLVVDDENMILSCIPSLITNVMNASLMRPISLSKLEEVVFGMHKGKAPDPDKFLVEFF